MNQLSTAGTNRAADGKAAPPTPSADIPVDRPDLAAVIEQHYPRIRRAALLMCGNGWEADDLAQETFLQAMRSWKTFAGKSAVSTWLYAILVNQHKKRIRASTRRQRRWLRWFQRGAERAPQRPDDKAEQEEWRASLWAAVAKLPTPQQQAVVLRYSEGLAYCEIAEVMGCPLGTAKSRIHHALAALREMLAEQGRSGNEAPIFPFPQRGEP